ncbi:MAG: fatty acyl-AMP ligase [Myxococcota bacterium]
MHQFLARNARLYGNQFGYTFLSSDGQSEKSLPYAQLARDASRRGGALKEAGLRAGERVAIAVDESAEFVPSFLGAMWAGLVPVPMFPPTDIRRITSYLDRSRRLLDRSDTKAVITSSRFKPLLAGFGVERLLVSSTALATGPECEPAPAEPDQEAFIQFTSGSTSDPRGVVVTHANLLANSQCIMGDQLEGRPGDVSCTWLPLYHDMGLIGFALASLVPALKVVFVPPTLFVQRPAIWLQTVSKHRGRISFAPNFGYGLCVKRVTDEQLEGVDLSSWKFAGCGAEPIDRRTLEAFSSRFSSWGFDPSAMVPCYGLAESTLAVSFSLGGVRSERLSASEFVSETRAEPTDHPDQFFEFVCCGPAFRGHEIRVVDDNGEVLSDRDIGNVEIRGPSVTKGYVSDPEHTRKLFDDGWLRTGDLGYLVDGELYVTGRLKDLIVVAGRNYYPKDIEEATYPLDGIRRGRVVAFSVQGVDGLEHAVVCAETERADNDLATDDLSFQIRKAVNEAIGLTVEDVVLVDRGALPRTSSGKLQRRQARDIYLADRFNGSNKDSLTKIVKTLSVAQWEVLRARLLRRRRADSRPQAAQDPS